MFARRRLFHQVWLGDTAQARQAAVGIWRPARLEGLLQMCRRLQRANLMQLQAAFASK
jgi:hypothetical protein